MTVEDLKKYKDGLYSSLSRELDAFEKNFILISSGILAFSVTFIKEIVKIDDATFLEFLFIGWLSIVIAIGLMMYAFLASVDASNELWKTVDDFMVSKDFYDNAQTMQVADAKQIKEATRKILFARKQRLSNFRFAAIWSFIIGITFFATFVGINLYRENTKDKSTRILNSKKSTITIKTGKTETTTNDSLIIIK